MHNELIDEILSELPKFNPDTCNGYAVKELEGAVEYIKNIFECASAGSDLKFIEIRPLSPEEEFQAITNKNRKPAKDQKKAKFDVAEYDANMVKITLEYFGTLYTTNTYIPFARNGGLMYMKGTPATIVPVLADRVFSVTPKGLFVIINRARFNLDLLQVPFTVSCNGETRSLNQYVIKSSLHNAFNKGKAGEGKKKMPDIYTTTGHYLFCKYGVSGAFKKYYNTDVIICKEDEVDNYKDGNINYVVCRSIYNNATGPKTIKDRTRPYIPHRIAILVPEDKMEEVGVRRLVASFFYVVDAFPNRFAIEEIEITTNWRLMLGFAIKRSAENEGRLVLEMDVHINSLDNYIDLTAIRYLESEGVTNVTDIYDFLSYVNDNIDWMTKEIEPGNMYNKYLQVNRYLLSPITDAIFSMYWFLVNKRKDGQFTKRELDWIISRHLIEQCWRQINSGHREKTNVQFAGDCMLFKHTCNSVRQVDAVSSRGGSKKRKLDENDPSYHLHASIAECSSVCNFSKRSLDGRSKINPCALTNEEGRYLQNPRFVDIIAQAQSEIEF